MDNITKIETENDEPEPCKYCGGSCEHDETNACDGYAGDIDSLYAATNQQEIRR
jgi:biotin synthase-like enzyme